MSVPTDTPDGMVLYQTNRAIIICGDAEQVLSGYRNEHADLIVTDPPYGAEWQSGFRAETFDRLHGDGRQDRDKVARIIAECVRLTGQKRHLYVFGPSDVLEGQRVSQTANLIWDKGRHGAGDLSSPWGPAHEPITFAVSQQRHPGKTGCEALPVRLRKGSVLRFHPPTGRSVRHPSEKPVPLLRELIESSSRQGELVLDPFAGSGSTGVAALLSGRRCLLVEADERWALMARERIAAVERVLASVEHA